MRSLRRAPLLPLLLLLGASHAAQPPPSAPPSPSSACVHTPTDEVKRASWFHCLNNSRQSGIYNLTNNTGCCASHTSSGVLFPGVCSLCTKSGQPEFSCKLPQDLTDSSFSLSWGFFVALVADVCISFGLAMQKVANTRIQRRLSALAQGAPEVQRDPTFTDLLSEPTWLMGISLTVGSEIGNFAAYGDPNTPSSIVASLGCVCVLCNWLLATLWLKEPFRVRDIGGVCLVLVGVLLIIIFVPKSPNAGTANLLPCPLVYWGHYAEAPCGVVPEFWYSGNSFDGKQLAPGPQVCEANLIVVGSDYWYIWQPVWVCYFILTFMALVASTLYLKKKGHTHPVLSLLPADLAGGYTVCAAVTVSTFLFDYVLGKGRFFVLAEPVFWVCLLVLAGTAVFQVSYLNKALAHFDAGVVVPTHFVLFTFFSIVGPSVLYHELSLDANFMLPAPVMLLLFLVGIALTFGGVFILGSGKGVAPEPPVATLTDLSSGLAANDSAAVGLEESVRSRTTSVDADKREHSTYLKWVNLHPNTFKSLPLPPPPPLDERPRTNSSSSVPHSIESASARDAANRSPTM